MHEDLCAKRATIHHSEMPSELLKNSQQDPPAPPTVKNPPTPTAPVDVDKIPKKPKLAPNPNNWNPILIRHRDVTHHVQ